jgi:hypothetical protein
MNHFAFASSELVHSSMIMHPCNAFCNSTVCQALNWI